jgi:hypothetical protein
LLLIAVSIAQAQFGMLGGGGGMLGGGGGRLGGGRLGLSPNGKILISHQVKFYQTVSIIDALNL